MAINRGNPKNISIHHSAVNPPAMNMAELKARASSHNNFHKANSEAWNNTTPGEYGYRWLRYHWMIAQDGSVLQTQDMKYALYANGDGVSSTSFNYNSVNIMVEGNYEIAKPTLAMELALVKLIRSIEKTYKINPMVRAHKQLSATGTACPGKNIGTSTGGWLKDTIAKVNDINYPAPADWRTEAKKLAQKTTYITNKDTALFEIDTGKRVTEFKKGTKIDVDYEYKSYYLTAWSYDRKVKNGFKQTDLTIYTAPPPPVNNPCEIEEEIIREQQHAIKKYTEEKKGLEEIIKASREQLEVAMDEIIRQGTKIENLKIEVKNKEEKIIKLKEQVNSKLVDMTVGEILEGLMVKIKSVWSKEEGE